MSKDCILPQPPSWSERMYISIPRPEIAFFKFMLESEHNLALMTVVDKYAAVIKLSYSPGQTQEMGHFLDRMQEQMPLNRLSVPGN
ncbi:MAG: DUF4911 domain-containing protein, partial [Desulfovermiculus sp.]